MSVPDPSIPLPSLLLRPSIQNQVSFQEIHPDNDDTDGGHDHDRQSFGNQAIGPCGGGGRNGLPASATIQLSHPMVKEGDGLTSSEIVSSTKDHQDITDHDGDDEGNGDDDDDDDEDDDNDSKKDYEEDLSSDCPVIDRRELYRTKSKESGMFSSMNSESFTLADLNPIDDVSSLEADDGEEVTEVEEVEVEEGGTDEVQLQEIFTKACRVTTRTAGGDYHGIGQAEDEVSELGCDVGDGQHGAHRGSLPSPRTAFLASQPPRLTKSISAPVGIDDLPGKQGYVAGFDIGKAKQYISELSLTPPKLRHLPDRPFHVRMDSGLSSLSEYEEVVVESVHDKYSDELGSPSQRLRHVPPRPPKIRMDSGLSSLSEYEEVVVEDEEEIVEEEIIEETETEDAEDAMTEDVDDKMAEDEIDVVERMEDEAESADSEMIGDEEAMVSEETVATAS